MIEEIKYQMEMFIRWLRYWYFRCIGIRRNFYCQSHIEGNKQCKYECDHCKEYYGLINTKFANTKLKIFECFDCTHCLENTYDFKVCDLGYGELEHCNGKYFIKRN